MSKMSGDRPDVIEVNFGDMFKKLSKHRQTVTSTVFLFVVVTALYSFFAKPIYQAKCRIMVNSKPPKIIKVEDVILPDYSDRANYFYSQIEVLKSRTLAQMVFNKLGGYEPWERRGHRASLLKKISAEERLEELLKHVQVSPVRMTEVIEVKVEDTDPKLASFIANNWARSYMFFSSVDQLIQRRAELEADMKQQLKYYKEQHPIIKGLQSEIGTIDEKLNNEQTRLSHLDNSSLGSLSWSSDLTNVKILDWAQTPVKPVRPRRLLYIFLALILGVLFGGAFVFLFESMNRTIKTMTDLEQFEGLSGLVAIPRLNKAKRRRDTYPELAADRQRHTLVAELFRVLRTGIVFSNPDFAKRTFVVTSASPLEGKTTIAVNLATVFAQANERTILVDADLHNPRLSHVFDIDTTNGITDILAYDKDDINPFIHKTEIAGLDLLTCGEEPPNPSELLGSKKMEKLIAKLLESYDRIIFDTPPVLAVTDAVVLSTKVDATILVVKAGGTLRQSVSQCLQALNSVNARLLGVVMNMVNEKEHEQYATYASSGLQQKKRDKTRRRPKKISRK